MNLIISLISFTFLGQYLDKSINSFLFVLISNQNYLDEFICKTIIVLHIVLQENTSRIFY